MYNCCKCGAIQLSSEHFCQKCSHRECTDCAHWGRPRWPDGQHAESSQRPQLRSHLTEPLTAWWKPNHNAPTTVSQEDDRQSAPATALDSPGLSTERGNWETLMEYSSLQVSATRGQSVSEPPSPPSPGGSRGVHKRRLNPIIFQSHRLSTLREESDHEPKGTDQQIIHSQRTQGTKPKAHSPLDLTEDDDGDPASDSFDLTLEEEVSSKAAMTETKSQGEQAAARQ